MSNGISTKSKKFKVVGTLFNREYCAYEADTKEQAKEWIASRLNGGFKERDFRIDSNESRQQ